MSPRRLTACAVVAVLAVVAVRGAAPPHAQAAPPRLHVTVTLVPRDPATLAAYARAVATPGSPQYGRYLTPHRFAARFGAGAARIARLRAALAAAHLHPGPPSAGGLSIPLTATARQLHTAGPRLARVLAPAERASVQALVGQSAGLAGHPLAVRDPRAADRGTPGGAGSRGSGRRGAAHARRSASAVTTTAGPTPCALATTSAQRDGAYTDDELARAYDFTPLYAAGDEGQGTTVAIYELEPNDPADIAAFQSCYGTHADVSYIHVDGGAGAGAGSDEAAFDIENLIGFAPRARVLVYQGPNSSSGLPGSGPYDVFSAIINQDRAQVVSVSWGQCEAQLGARASEAEHLLLEQAAIEGQTFVAAAGDDGAEDCDTGGAKSSDRAAVDDPASQPNVVGVGGTSLRALGPPVVQTAWNSREANPGGAAIGAGGGGVSSQWPMPASQYDTPAWLHVHRTVAAGRRCGRSNGFCREVPDVAADADPTTGYEIYWNGADTVPEPSGWQALGGTSGAAPLWAALFALADGDPTCGHSPLGEAGPALYRAATGHYAADFQDVTQGENDFTGTDDGRWPAGAGYDLATGLGTPHAAALVAQLCADALRLDPIAGQSSALGAAVRLTLHGSDARGARLRYAATHLPPGVRINAHTGAITGRPRRPGAYSVTALVRDGRGAIASRRLHWVVGAAPRLTAASLADGRLTLTVRSGRHAPWLRRLRVHLPAGLRVSDHARVTVTGHGVGARAAIAGDVVTVTLASPAAALQIAIPVRGSLAVDQVSVGVRAGSTGTSVLTRELSVVGS